jgi:hypothetical protein
MGKTRETKTHKRHEEIFEEYEKAHAEFLAKFKEHAPYTSKKHLYEEVAFRLGWSVGHVYHVVNNMLKNRK